MALTAQPPDATPPPTARNHVDLEEIKHLLTEGELLHPITVRQLDGCGVDRTNLVWVRVQTAGIYYVIYPAFQFAPNGHVLPATTSAVNWIRAMLFNLFEKGEAAKKIAAWWITPTPGIHFHDDDPGTERTPLECLRQLSLNPVSRQVDDPAAMLRFAAIRFYQITDARQAGGRAQRA